MAEKPARDAYEEMQKSQEFQQPISYQQIQAGDYAALLLPGGHDKGMREYLESPILMRVVAHFFDTEQPVGAICHGTLLAARSPSLADPRRAGHSVLWGRKTTGLTRSQEMTAYQLTRVWLGDYYRTYETPMADELISYLRSPDDYSPGPGWPVPMQRDSEENLSAGFTLKDGNYLSARWPGDAYRFAFDFLSILQEAGVAPTL